MVDFLYRDMYYRNTMPLNIKNSKVEKLAGEVARLTGETKTEAIRKALEERKSRLVYRVAGHDRAARVRRFLTYEAWPLVPKKELGRKLSREEEEALLGYGPEGA
jgi:antitoxin VapB